MFIVLNNRKEPFEAPIELLFLHLNDHPFARVFSLEKWCKRFCFNKIKKLLSIFTFHYDEIQSYFKFKWQQMTKIWYFSFVSNSMSQIHLPLRLDNNEKFEEKKHINRYTIPFRMDLFPFSSDLLPFVSRQRYPFIYFLDALLHFTSIQSKQKHVINIGIVIEHLFDNNKNENKNETHSLENEKPKIIELYWKWIVITIFWCVSIK